VNDNKTKFRLALACGNIEVAMHTVSTQYRAFRASCNMLMNCGDEAMCRTIDRSGLFTLQLVKNCLLLAVTL
jgi:hypothetical protein